MKTWQGILFGLFSGLLAAALILIVDSRPRGNPVKLLPTWTPSPIAVHIAGAVMKPGVYYLSSQSRITELVAAAGGFSPEADQSAVNLAAKLRDGEKISIPILASSESSLNRNSTVDILNTTTPVPEPGIVNINFATVDELDRLPGIGVSKAQAIVDYRTKHGDFKSLQEILNVPGIGPSIFRQIESFITIE